MPRYFLKVGGLLITGTHHEGYFDLFVTSDGEIQYLVLNGIKIDKEDADLNKLVNLYLKRKEQEAMRNVFYGWD